LFNILDDHPFWMNMIKLGGCILMLLFTKVVSFLH
jgi:hypothetical protein